MTPSDFLIMLATVATFDTIIINVIIAFYMRKYGLSKVAKFAKMYMSHLGVKSQEAQHTAKQKELAAGAKDKMAKAAMEEVPLLGRIAERAGVSGEEIFAVLQDKEFLNGMGVIVDIGDSLIKRLRGTGEEKPKESKPKKVSDQNQFGLPNYE